MATYPESLLKFAKLNKQPHFRRDGELTDCAKKLKRFWEETDSLISALGITNNEWKRDLMIYAGGPEFRKAQETVTAPTTGNHYTQFKAQLETYFYVNALKRISRVQLWTTAQRPHETANEFQNRLTQLYEDSGYGDTVTKAEMLRDRLVAGFSSEKVRTHVLEYSDTDFTLANVMTYANAASAANVTSKAMHSIQNGSAQVHRNFTGNHGKQQCGNCGNAHGSSADCPARNAICNACKKKGHFAKVCRSSNKKPQGNKKHQKKGKNKWKCSSKKVETEDTQTSQHDQDSLALLASHLGV